LRPAPARAAAAPAGQAKKGGVLRIGQQFDINPTRVYSITYQHYSIIYSIFDTLIRLDARNKPQPELANPGEAARTRSSSRSSCVGACAFTAAAR